jgi:putative transposase
MSEAKVQPEGYIQFLLASPVQFTCTEAARVQPVQPDAPAHDAFNRLLTGRPPDPVSGHGGIERKTREVKRGAG